MTEVSDEMVEAALFQYDYVTSGIGWNDTKRMRSAISAALAVAPKPSLLETRNDEAGFVEYVNSDVPYIVRDIHGQTAILLDVETRAVIGYRVYDSAAARPAPTVEQGPVMSEERKLIQDLWGALNFILAFYEPEQTYLDTEAWKQAEAGGKRARQSAREYLARHALTGGEGQL